MRLESVRLDHAAKVYVASGKLPMYPQLLGNAAVVSDELMTEDLFTSAPVYQCTCDARKTRWGIEEITRQGIPGVPEEKLAHLDPRGIVRVGSTVRFGDILVGKIAPKSRYDLTTEEKLLHSIFGSAGEDLMDASLTYPLHDPGMVSRVHHEFLDDGDVLVLVRIEVVVRRELRIGDVLEDGKGNRITVSGIVPAPEMPCVSARRVDVLLGPTSTLNLHRKIVLRGKTGPRAKKLGEGYGDEIRFEKVPLLFEDKCVVRSIGGPYGLISQMPLDSATHSGGQWVRLDTLTELWRQGYAMNARELVSIKCDAIEGRTRAYEALLLGTPVPFGIPETTRHFGTLLRALCHSLTFRTEGGEEKAFTEEDPGSVVSLAVKGATRQDVESWSAGEVPKPETINYRTYRPVPGGLFCERIFGPEREWECTCGKYRGMKYKGKVCERCGVTVMHSRVRRSRLGQITLAWPVVHCWYVPTLAEMFDLKLEQFRQILCGAAELTADLPLVIRSGPLAVKEALERRGVNLGGFIIETLPVLPPDLRPLVLLDNGNFATSDLNALYRRILNRNQRLGKLIRLGAPETILRNERQMLQLSVDALFENARLKRPLLDDRDRPLQSLTDELEHVLRQMTEKRVDYSARVVAVPDPAMREGTVGVPGLVLRELFKPSLVRELKKRNVADTVRGATKLIDLEPESPNVREALSCAMADRPLLVVTDQRMFAACQPMLVDGEAVRFHPTDASKLGLTFRGEQVVLHVPLSEAAVAEARRPQPRGDVVPVLPHMTPATVVSSVISGTPITLTDFDRMLLGIGT